MILTPSEVRRACDAFPTKFLDIKAHHILLAGEDPFLDLDVKRENVRLRVEQELRNLTLRLRRRWIAAEHEPGLLAQTLAGAVVPLSIQLLSLLKIAGRDVPSHDDPASVFQAASAAFELDGEALKSLHQGEAPDPAALFARVLACVEKSADLVDRLEDRP